jgi:calcineurin-like phosphoesterase family protein
MNIWIIADTHFGHDNMIPYCGRPKDFDDQIISNWNKVVQHEDVVIHLGDVIFGQNKDTRLPSIMASLPGKKILCRGNHDPKPGVWYMEHGFDFVCDSFVYDRYLFSHCPITPLPKQANYNWQKDINLNIHGHFHNKFPTNPNFDNDLYDVKYYLANKEKYHLVSIEPDALRPFSLEEVIGAWLSENGGEKNEL